MTKAEVLQSLKDSGQIHRPKDTKLWQIAFDLYSNETMQPVSTRCNKCFDKVKRWLKQ